MVQDNDGRAEKFMATGGWRSRTETMTPRGLPQDVRQTQYGHDRDGMMSIPDGAAARAALKALPWSERRAILAAISSGRRVDDARQAALAAGLAVHQRAQLRRWFWFLPLMAAVASAGIWVVDRSTVDPMPFAGVAASGGIGALFVGGLFWWQARRALAAQVLNEELARSVRGRAGVGYDLSTAETIPAGAVGVPGAELFQASAALLLVAAAVNMASLEMPAGLLSLFTPLLVFAFVVRDARERSGRIGLALLVSHVFGLTHFAGSRSGPLAVAGVAMTALGAVTATAALAASRSHRRARRAEKRRVEDLGGPKRLWSRYRAQSRWRQIVIAVVVLPPAAFVVAGIVVGMVEAALEGGGT